jgi:hypothetical protein
MRWRARFDLALCDDPRVQRWLEQISIKKGVD